MSRRSHSSLTRVAVVVAALAPMVALTGTASAHSDTVRRACKHDYFQFCPSYSVGSSALRSCMKSVGRNLSLGCRRALANEGEIPQKYAR